MLRDTCMEVQQRAATGKKQFQRQSREREGGGNHQPFLAIDNSLKYVRNCVYWNMREYLTLCEVSPSHSLPLKTLSPSWESWTHTHRGQDVIDFYSVVLFDISQILGNKALVSKIGTPESTRTKRVLQVFMSRQSDAIVDAFATPEVWWLEIYCSYPLQISSDTRKNKKEISTLTLQVCF